MLQNQLVPFVDVSVQIPSLELPDFIYLQESCDFSDGCVCLADGIRAKWVLSVKFADGISSRFVPTSHFERRA